MAPAGAAVRGRNRTAASPTFEPSFSAPKKDDDIMTVFSARILVGGSLLMADAIEHEGKLWLVPNWLDVPDGKSKTPTRIIRFDNLRYSDLRGKSLIDFLLQVPMPDELFGFETPTSPVVGFEFRESPDILVAKPSRQ
jgi:hypothetical protein